MLALTMGVASISSAQARDSFSIGVNIGGYGYAPPAVYYPEPVYYHEPIVYYREPVYCQLHSKDFFKSGITASM